MKRFRRKRYNPTDGRCCADCDLFTESQDSGRSKNFITEGKYRRFIFGICELAEKNVNDCDNFYCKHFQTRRSKNDT